MKITDNGYTITEVASLEKIEIKDCGSYVETDLTGAGGRPLASFDLNGLRDFVAGMLVALREAERVAEQNGYRVQ